MLASPPRPSRRYAVYPLPLPSANADIASPQPLWFAVI
jgi:hypothetical protein